MHRRWKRYILAYLDNQESDYYPIFSYNFVLLCGRFDLDFLATGPPICIFDPPNTKIEIFNAQEVEKLYSCVSR